MQSVLYYSSVLYYTILVPRNMSVSCTPPPLVVPHPLSFPRGGWGTVTWSTQNFSLRLIVLLCG